MVAFAFAPNAIVAALLLVLVHSGGSIVWVSSTQLLQLTVPNHFLGRVSSVELAAFTLAMSLSSALTGWMVGREVTTVRGATFVMAAAAAGSAVVWGVSMARLGKRLDDAAATNDKPISRRHIDAPA